MTRTRSFLHAVGSLWLAALLLLLLMVAMACATVFEAEHGTERALREFYTSWWFQILLLIFGLNAVAAMVVRWPFSRRQIGFVVAHASILVILVGAWVTKRWSTDGRIALVEGQTTGFVEMRGNMIALEDEKGARRASVELSDEDLAGSRGGGRAGQTVVDVDGVQVRLRDFLPDSEMTEAVVDGVSGGHAAVELLLNMGGQERRTWVFADVPGEQASKPISFRVIEGARELDRMTATAPASRPASKGTVHVAVKDRVFDFSVEECTESPVAIGDTGYTMRVLRHVPDAVIGEDRELRSAGDGRVNPAVEVELSGAAGVSKRLAFARFPDFASMHGTPQEEEVKVTFIAAEAEPSLPLIEILGDGGGRLLVRFNTASVPGAARDVTLGSPLDTVWPGVRLAVLRRFDHASVERRLEPVTPARENPVPAVLLDITTPAGSEQTWVQKHTSRPVGGDDGRYDVSFAELSVPLGFDVRLDSFQIGRYPGTNRPMSFKSNVAFIDPAGGRTKNEIISMNDPASHGGYTFFQSDYRENPGGRHVSFLSVSRDPGEPIVFGGYAALLIGTLWGLVMRVKDRRRAAEAAAVAVPQVSMEGRA